MSATRPMAEVFISYRRTQLERVRPAVKALEEAGICCFLDVQDIAPLEPFPERLRQAIGDSMVLLAWWSADYADSSHCMDEFRLAWQHARRQTSALHTRLWVLNPEPQVGHIHAGELDTQNFLCPPQPGQEAAWAQGLAPHLQGQLAGLHALGPLAHEGHALPAGSLVAVPHKSRHFTGRGAELMRIHSQLHPPKVGSQARAVAVQTHGMPGIGKTELATAYAHDFAHAYPGGVFWLSLAALDQVAAVDEHQGQFAWLRAVDAALQYQPALAALLRDGQGQLVAPLQARQRLAGHPLSGPALWVLDNVPVFKRLDLRDALLAFWRAPFAIAHTLVTTRDSGDMADFAPVHLDTLPVDDALRLLASHRRMAGPEEMAAAQAIVKQTGGHTLALVLLGEYIKTSAHGYTRLWKDMNATGTVQRIEAVSQVLQASLGDRARGVLAAYAISLRPLSAHARHLLALAALCEGNSPFPAALLVDTAQMDSDAASAALRSLQQSALLTQRLGADSALPLVEIHPLTAQVCQALLLIPEADAASMRQALAQRLLVVLERAGDIHQHAHIRPYLAQAQYFATVLGESSSAASLVSWVGRYFLASGHYRLAQEAFTQALEINVQVLGEEHPDSLTNINDLANALNALGNWIGAKTMLRQALDMRLRVQGEEHPHTLTCMNSLASTLCALGEFANAEFMQRRVLELRQGELGEEHLDTLTIMNNLANTLNAVGDWAGAESMLRRALEVRLRVQREEHTGTLTCMNNLAHALRSRGELAGAWAMEQRVLGIRQRVQGDEHPDTLTSMNNLAATLRAMGDWAGARTMEQQVLKARQRVLGEEHPDTLTSMSNLAGTLSAMGDSAGARIMEQQVLEVRQRVLGEEHPNTLTSMNNLVGTLHAMGDWTGAQSLLNHVLHLSQRVLGDEHPDTILVRDNLQSVQLALNQTSGAGD